jgi:hypothetical protein
MKLRFRPLLALGLVVALGAGAIVFQAGAKDARTSNSASTNRNGFLGVNLQDLTKGLRDSYDYEGTGALVSSVVRGSPADEVGIEEGDIVTKFNDLAVNNADQLTARVRAMNPGALASVWVWRDGKEIYLGRAELSDRTDRNSYDDDDWGNTPRAPRAPRAPRPPRPESNWNWNWDRDHRAPRANTRVFTMSRGRLGVETRDLDDDLGSYFGSPDGKGVLILRVVDDTPADKAGLKVGDVILAVGGTNVDDTDALRRALRDREAGAVDLKIRRKGAVRTMSVELDERHSGMWQDGGNWMGWMDDGEDGDGPHVIRLKNLDGLDGLDAFDGFDAFDHMDQFDHMEGFKPLSPEDREQLRKDLDRLREDLKDLRVEVKSKSKVNAD